MADAPYLKADALAVTDIQQGLSVGIDEAPACASLPWKLWIYTNYDCNLRCSYCVARSSPNAPRRHRLVQCEAPGG